MCCTCSWQTKHSNFNTRVKQYGNIRSNYEAGRAVATTKPWAFDRLCDLHGDLSISKVSARDAVCELPCHTLFDTNEKMPRSEFEPGVREKQCLLTAALVSFQWKKNHEQDITPTKVDIHVLPSRTITSMALTVIGSDQQSKPSQMESRNRKESSHKNFQYLQQCGLRMIASLQCAQNSETGATYNKL